MPPRARLPVGTELIVALPVCVQRRSDQANLWLSAHDRLVIENDFSGLIFGRVLSGKKVGISFVHGDLGRMTYADGRAVVPGGVTGAAAVAPTGAPVPSAPLPQAPPAVGYLKGRRLLDPWDMPR